MPPTAPVNSEFFAYLDDPTVKWHGVLPMDLGFVGKTLSGGLEATSDFADWNSLCVSGSPGTSIKDAHDLRSFLEYSMKPTRLSMAVRTDKVVRPTRLFFEDEYITTDRVPSSGIVAVAANERTLATPLSEVKPRTEDRINFKREIDYLQSNIDWARWLGGAAVGDALQQSLLPPMSQRSPKVVLTDQRIMRMQKSIFQKVAECLRAELGREPTVRDALELTIRKAGSSAVILTWDDRAAQALQDVNRRITRKEPNIHSLSAVAEELSRPSAAPVAGDAALPAAAAGATSSTQHAMRAAAARIFSVTTADRKGHADAAAPAAERERSSWQRIRSALGSSAARPGSPFAGRTR